MPTSIIWFSVVPYPCSFLSISSMECELYHCACFFYVRMSVESLNALVLSIAYRANQTESLPHCSLFCVQLAICTNRSCDNIFIKMKVI